MKKLKLNKSKSIPGIVLFIYGMASIGSPISSNIFDKALDEYPEYFPEEVEHRRKWNSIPQQVHDDYYKEWSALLESEIYKEVGRSKGFLWMLDHQEEFQEWNTKYKECLKNKDPLFKKLHEKFYGPYDIKYEG